MTDIAADTCSHQAYQQQLRSPAAPRGDVAVVLVISFCATAFNVPLHMVSPALAIAVQLVIGVSVMVRIPSYAPAVVVFLFLFQNLFVSAFSPLVSDINELNFLRGYNFLTIVVMWLVAYAEYFFKGGLAAPATRLMNVSTWALAVISLYFVYGFTQSGVDATIYLRNIALPIFLFQLCLLTSVSSSVRLTPLFVTMAGMVLVCGYIELLFRDFWLEITNGSSYWMIRIREYLDAGRFDRALRETGQVFLDYRDVFRSSLFNTNLFGSGSYEVLRLNGPNMAVIPFGYALAFLFLFLTAVGLWPMALFLLPLLLFASAKGPVILIVFVLAAWTSTRLVGAVFTIVVFALALVAYALLGVITGVQSGDYHAIGFMGGLNGFFDNPLGRGLGIGGNLSGENFAQIDWSTAQAQGATDGAFESSVGVLLYQMGVGAIALLALYLWIGFSCWKLYARSGIAAQGLAAFGMFVIVTNGIFQEEAMFSPTALGLIVSLAGLVLGSHYRARYELINRSA